MAVPRELFLDAAGVVAGVLGHDEVERRWHEPSVLPGMSVGALAAHAARAVLQVQRYLDEAGGGDADRGAVVDAGGYYAALDGLDDPASELSRGVVERADLEASAGPGEVRAALGAALAQLRDRLPGLSPERTVSARSHTLTVDEYLRTRLVEICVHVEDLALSLGTAPPGLDPAAIRVAVDVLVDVAVARHGPAAVLRALARRDRDEVQALRVL